MQALVYDQRLELRSDYPDPARAAGESIVHVSLAGICGTDLEIARGFMSFSGVPGHEFVGRVVETDNPELRGKRVVGEINSGCGRCLECRSGLVRHCASRTVLGILGRDGAFAEFLRLPDINLVSVPDSISDEAAAFVEPIAAAYEIFEQVHLDRNKSIVVLGDGRLGGLVALALKAENYQPLVAGHHADKLERLGELGIETVEEKAVTGKFDVVVDCSGQGLGFQRALELVKPRATIILKSTAAAGALLNLAPVVINEITVLGSRCGRFAPALEALAAGRIDPRPLIDRTFSLSEGLHAIESAALPYHFKILLKPA
jgi:threonine dehydrogenase-like Zn-dependent dehydrogenase